MCTVWHIWSAKVNIIRSFRCKCVSFFGNTCKGGPAINQIVAYCKHVDGKWIDSINNSRPFADHTDSFQSKCASFSGNACKGKSATNQIDADGKWIISINNYRPFAVCGYTDAKWDGKKKDSQSFADYKHTISESNCAFEHPRIVTDRDPTDAKWCCAPNNVHIYGQQIDAKMCGFYIA